MCADPQVRHRGLVQYARDPELGEVRTSAPQSESAKACVCAKSPPKLGQHNAEIFGRLGETEAEMRDLRAKGVL
jgi:formyl-CoA transferase